MSTKAGQLLWNRERLTLASGANDIDTGLTQLNKGFENDSLGEPFLGVGATVSPGAGVGAPSRIQVVPLLPTSTWAGVTMDEPYFNTTTNTVHVVLHNISESPRVGVNVLFWDPHTLIGPGDADTYTAPR